MNVYKTYLKFQSGRFTVRNLEKRDAADLLKVYSDKNAVPYFNGDNCHGDDFFYATEERMRQAVDFWLYSYEQGYFVRWSIVDNVCKQAIGTCELFHRDSHDAFDNCGLLRLDLKHDYEKAEYIEEIVSSFLPQVFDLFYCDKVATKIPDFAHERRKALEKLGFEKRSEPLIGNEGEEYYGYYSLIKQ